MAEVQRKLGCIADRSWHRGFGLQQRWFSETDVPETYDGRKWVDRIRDQGATGSCVGQAVARAIHVVLRQLHGDAARFPSALHLYDVARRQYYGTLQDKLPDEGTAIGSCVDAIEDIGWANEDDIPFQESRVRESLFWNEYEKALPQATLMARRLFEPSEEQLEQYLCHGFPLVCGIDVDGTFMDWSARRKPWDGPTEGVVGGHAMCVVGYDAESFDVVNSWGGGWGDYGFVRLSKRALRKARSLWVFDGSLL